MTRLHLFEATGLEIEYMIVDRESLVLRPIADVALATLASRIAERAGAGGEGEGDESASKVASEVEVGELAWSNELVLHVLELKTNGPARAIDDALLARFDEEVRAMDDLLAEHGARLLPTAMHPFMDPITETKLWPHEYGPVYRAFDRIFDCRGHGWSNLQSLHLNFPFAGDDELGRLHAAIRLVLPILPALAASSPLVEGAFGPALDNRLEFYRRNSRAVPSVAGQVVPESVLDEASYRREILEPMWRDIAPLDEEGVLRDEFLNARGAIARFVRGSIEIRVLDSQECVRADLAIGAGVRALLRHVVAERFTSFVEQQRHDTGDLARLFRATLLDGEAAWIDDASYLAVFGQGEAQSAGALWSRIVDALEAGSPAVEPLDPAWVSTLRAMIRRGPLARRIRRALGPAPEIAAIRAVYARLADCLARDELF